MVLNIKKILQVERRSLLESLFIFLKLKQPYIKYRVVYEDGYCYAEYKTFIFWTRLKHYISGHEETYLDDIKCSSLEEALNYTEEHYIKYCQYSNKFILTSFEKSIIDTKVDNLLNE